MARRTASVADGQPLRQLRRKLGGAHAVLDAADFVWRAPDLDDGRILVVRCERRLRIVVARLSDTARVDDIAALRDDVYFAAMRQLEVVRAPGIILEEHLCDVRVTDERQRHARVRKGGLRILHVENVVEMEDRSAVDDLKTSEVTLARQLRKPSTVVGGKNAARPLDRLLSKRIERLRFFA